MKKDMDLARRIRGDRFKDFIYRGDHDMDDQFMQMPYKDQKYGMQQITNMVLQW